MMKKRLVILSDLWGRRRSEWLINYTQPLSDSFKIKYYDCCELGGVSKLDYSEATLHKQFVDGGIERAVEKLIELEKDPVTILAFSIGGTIAWRYGIRSGKTSALVCVSSTRLRYETIRPNGRIFLYFGGEDPFKPDAEWLARMNVDVKILANRKHQLYRASDIAEQISKVVSRNE